VNNIMNIIQSIQLEYHEKKHQLAYEAENSLPYITISTTAADYLKDGVLCDVLEGHSPYRPRYILPDYQKFMKTGSEYLNLPVPINLYEAINALLILYRYVPSITGYPVYLGQVDEILEEYKDTVSPTELENLLRMFLIQIDRTLPDAFVHMNIGPKDTVIGRTILKLETELKKAVPNLSLKYDENTPDEFAKLALETALITGKPYFIHHTALCNTLGEKYGIASCYNSLLIGGGSHTLVRLNLKEAAKKAASYEDFLTSILPETIHALCEIINARASFIVEKTKFFESSFLAREGLINLKNFTSMAGVFGLYECIEVLSGGLKLGTDSKAKDMAEEILEKARTLLQEQPGAYCHGTGGKIGFHAQSGIDCDNDVTAGVRIRIGNEPQLFEQIEIAAALQQYFNTGVSDIYLFDATAQQNLDGLLTIVKGAIKQGLRIMAINRHDGDLVRITGYLVKKTDIEKHATGQPLREGTVKLGANSINNHNILDRKTHKL
jgi:YjjI family glycine radical enzyme